MPTKTVSRQQSQTPAQQLQLQQQRDVENGLYPNIPPERRSPQARPVRPPTLRQDTIDMEEIPLNQANAMQEPEDRRKMREIFDKVKQCSLSHSTPFCLTLSHFLLCVRVMNEFPCCPCRESCGESSTMTPSISPPSHTHLHHSPSPNHDCPLAYASSCTHSHALFLCICRCDCAPALSRWAGQGDLIASSERQLRHSGQLQSVSHTFACLFLLVLCKLTK